MELASKEHFFHKASTSIFRKMPPVRAYDTIINSLDFAELGIGLDPNKVGCHQYDPKVMLKLLVYGYSYGIRSSPKLERQIH